MPTKNYQLILKQVRRHLHRKQIIGIHRLKVPKDPDQLEIPVLSQLKTYLSEFLEEWCSQIYLNFEFFRALYEKIIVLEQKSREQDIIIANMSDQILSNNVTMSHLSHRLCGGNYVWYITDFKSKMNQMHNNPSIMFYSPGFFTSYYGYKFCIRLNLSPRNPNFIALLIHMMKTDHDNTLDWPFCGRIIISIIHPT